MDNLTALMSCFARAWHTRNTADPVFSDPYARAILGKDYDAIAAKLLSGRSFFLSYHHGSDEETLRTIVNRIICQVSSPGARSAKRRRISNTALAAVRPF